MLSRVASFPTLGKSRTLKLIDLLQPWIILGIVVMVQFVAVVLFVTDTVSSFTLSQEKLDLYGAAFYFFVMFVMVVLLYGFSYKIRYIYDAPVIFKGINFGFLKSVVMVISVLCVGSVAWIYASTADGLSFFEYIEKCTHGLAHSFQGSGYRFSIVFPVVNCVLLPFVRKEHALHISAMMMTFIGAILISTIFAARLVLLLCVCAYAVVYLRLWLAQKTVRVATIFGIVVALVVLFVVFVFLQGYRDYESGGGSYYTNSVFIWGLSRLIDYPLSTVMYTSNFIDMLNRGADLQMSFFAPTLERFVETENTWMNWLWDFRVGYGQPYYTNLGGFGSLIANAQYAGIIFLLLFVVASGAVFRAFAKGSVLALFWYPLFFYSLFDLWRLVYIITELAEVELFLLLLVYLFAKKSRPEAHVRQSSV